MDRRQFIRGIGIGAFGAALLPGCGTKKLGLFPPSGSKDSAPRRVEDSERIVRFGLLTDPHYADKPASGSRIYRDSDEKLADAIRVFNEREVDFIIETGDFKDQGPDETATLAYLRAIESEFRKFNGPTYHVLGNHDMDNISKARFLAAVTNTGIARDRTYYSFDARGVHFVVLDANFRSDGADYDHGNFDWTDANIPRPQIDWLAADLASAQAPVIVFIHQLLDGEGSHYVNNAAAVRTVLEASGKVTAVFQGHQHSGGHSRIHGIHYHTLKAMVEGPHPRNNAFAVVEVGSDGTIAIDGHGRAEDGELVLS